MWRATIAMCLAGAATLFATMPGALDPDQSDHGWVVAIALLWIGTALVLADHTLRVATTRFRR